MSKDEICEWMDLGLRLKAACPEKYEEIVDALANTVGAQETIAAYDWQLWMTGKRPRKTYEA